MKSILLVTPDFDPAETKSRSLASQDNSKVASLPFFDKKTFMVPLGLATVAALTPDDIEVTIWDEGVNGYIDDDTKFDASYDLVGVTGYASHMGRVIQLGQIFRRRGVKVAVGGPGVSSAPEHYRDHFDVVFIGEAEYVWPRFIDDWKNGRHESEYRQVDKVNMEDSPIPRWDRLASNLSDYLVAGVQTTRGCPFDCEFCDVIYLYGRQARNKSVDQVLNEIRVLEELGVRQIFFCDDNFIGNPKYAKSLLKAVIELNETFRYPIGYFTQLTINVAKDDEMLELLADANFVGIFVGIETPNIESLKETNKPQNYKTDMVADVKKVHSYGLPISAGMIVGFDHDDTTIFDKQFEFLQETGIAVPLLNTLYAPVGTKLWIRLLKEERVVRLVSDSSTTSVNQELDTGFASFTNIIPKGMTRIELFLGYRSLVERVRDWDNFEARVKTFISQVTREQKINRRPVSKKAALQVLKFILFTMNNKERMTTIRLLWYTRKHARFLMGRVGWLIARQYILKAQSVDVLKAIDENIELEKADTSMLQVERTYFVVPDAFRKDFKAIFPDLYHRVHQGLIDKSRVHEALVEVTYDFLTRWGLTFEQFEEHHLTFLQEVSDRTIAKENNNKQGTAVAITDEGEVSDELAGLSEGHATIKLKRLADDVLRLVEQDMRSFQPAP